jgi:hypothetical protein
VAVAIALVSLTMPFVPIAWTAIGAGGEAVADVAMSVGGIALFAVEAPSQIYQTYQEHEDVKFAFAASASLGLDRYFDAASRMTPWWQTGITVFGEAVMAGAGVRQIREAVLKKLGEGLSWWRGARTAVRLQQSQAPSLAGLSAQEQYDLALFEMKEQQAIAEGAIGSPGGEAANALLQRLARAPGAAEIPAIERELQNAALLELTNAETAIAPAALAESQQITRVGIAAEVQAAQAAEEAEAVREILAMAPRPPAPGEIAPVGAAFETCAGCPLRAGPWKIDMVTAGGGMQPTTFDIEWSIKAGSFQQVYSLRGVPKNLPEPLIPQLQGKRIALKVGMRPSAVTLGMKPEELALYPELRVDMMQRLKQASALIGADQSIPHAAFQVFETEGLVLQELLVPEKGRLEFARDFLADLTQDKRVAVAQLAQKLWNKGLVFADFHLGNIYLEKEGGTWVAKILDPDFITRFGGPRMPGAVEFERFQALNPRGGYRFTSDSVDRSVTNAIDAQMKALENTGMMFFKYTTRSYAEGGFFQPSDFAGILPPGWKFMPK